MSSVLSLFGWGSAAKATEAAAPESQAPAQTTPAIPSLPSLVRATSTEDEFVLVDGDQSSNSSSGVHSRRSSLDESMIDVSKEVTQAAKEASTLAPTPAVTAVEAPLKAESTPAASPAVESPIKVASPTTRACRPYGHAHAACRPYGHAHSPPALLPATVAQAAAATLPVVAASPSASPSKRSFAAVAAATSSSSSPSKKGLVAYAQSAEIDLAEQLRLQIALIESQIARDKSLAPEDPLEYSAPLAKTQVRVPLNRDQALRYNLNAKTQVDPLAIEEPSSKRAKRTAPSGVTLTKEAAAAKLAKSKAKPHKVARKEEKQMRRERGDKIEAAVDVSA